MRGIKGRAISSFPAEQSRTNYYGVLCKLGSGSLTDPRLTAHLVFSIYTLQCHCPVYPVQYLPRMPLHREAVGPYCLGRSFPSRPLSHRRPRWGPQVDRRWTESMKRVREADLQPRQLTEPPLDWPPSCWRLHLAPSCWLRRLSSPACPRSGAQPA
ncbi:hypothetical protein BO71DRAFT_13352 [Aspergillus ellipticus CBS 707.79]|uniref:Uncharacterized protein n=1 Tax=Aspergillus ellipticus CBS 707.79 TaxID=1448320 RepID=A0A319F2B5_9EURO|nr:hypothetical protein BO71DRAFT_13352 [Aspergillus ellipticus CBS 707.79]